MVENQPFRRLSHIDQASADDILVEISKVGGTIIARLLLPAFLSLEQPRYTDLGMAATRARRIAAEYQLGLAVTVDPFTRPDWNPVWNACFGILGGSEAEAPQVSPTFRSR